MRYVILSMLCASGLLSAAPVDGKKDALAVAPDVYKLAFENERVRVLSFVTQPGQKWALRSHPDSLAVALSEYSVRNLAPGKVPSERHSKPGDDWSNPALRRSFQIIRVTSTSSMTIPSTSASPSAPPSPPCSLSWIAPIPAGMLWRKE